MSNLVKRNLKQFFTHNYQVLEPFIAAYRQNTDALVVDPFAGDGHLLRDYENTLAIDIDPEVQPDIVVNSFTSLSQHVPQDKPYIIITNPPYSHQHVLQKQDPELYDIVKQAGYVDLYEYSISRIIKQLGFPQIFAILPENFIASRTTKLRREIHNHIRAVQIHTVSTSDSTDQPTVMVYLSPDTATDTELWLDTRRQDNITIDKDGLRPRIPETANHVDFGLKDGQTDERRDTSILLQATDGGSANNRIKLMRVGERFNTRHFHNKISDRAYIQIVPHSVMSEEQIAVLITRFNAWIDEWRESTNGLGLTSFRSNTGNGFRRKRLDFLLARRVINWIVADHIVPGALSRPNP